MNWTVHGHKCLSSFLFFRFFKLREREREREWYIKFGYKGEIAPKLLILFFDWVPWRIFLLLRANRLYAIFNTGLKNSGPSCLRYSFVFFTRSTWLWFVCPLRTLSNNWLFYFSISADGKESPLPFWGPSQSLGFSLPSSWSADFLGLLDVTQVRLLSTNICWSSPRPTFFLNDLPLFIPTGG